MKIEIENIDSVVNKINIDRVSSFCCKIKKGNFIGSKYNPKDDVQGYFFVYQVRNTFFKEIHKIPVVYIVNKVGYIKKDAPLIG